LKRKYVGAKRPGFSLTEMLVVVLIMGVLVGVVGSLMGNFVTNFEITDDQSIARRRAQDVFNILQTPILNAGLGIPPNRFDHYFAPVSGLGGAPIRTWDGPIEVIPHDASVTSFVATENRGEALRVVYSIHSGVKNVSDADITTFSGPLGSEAHTELTLTGNAPIGGGDGILIAGAGTNMVRSYITFPGISMHPEMVTAYDPANMRLTVYGKTPHAESGNDVVSRDVIRPYHDMFLVKAGLAYVDDNGTFCLYDINDDVFERGDKLPTAAKADADGELVYRVEGIKAVRFVREMSGDTVRGVNVHVLAEGDNAVTGRSSTSFAVQQLRNRWPEIINWNDEMYYEDFEMRWRTRNIEAHTP
jgi:prepilin-type N-terminal cleavage/methylation domain-containing protein